MTRELKTHVSCEIFTGSSPYALVKENVYKRVFERVMLSFICLHAIFAVNQSNLITRKKKVA